MYFTLFWLLPGALGVFFFILSYFLSQNSTKIGLDEYTNKDLIYTALTCVIGVALGLFTLLFSLIVTSEEVYKWCSNNASIKNWLNKKPFNKD